MSHVLIKFKDLNVSCIKLIMNAKFGYNMNKFEEDTLRDQFAFGSDEFLYRVNNEILYRVNSGTDLDIVVRKVASKINEYPFVSDVSLSWEGIVDRYTIEVKGARSCIDETIGSISNSFYGTTVKVNQEDIRKYFESDRKAILDVYKRDTKYLRIPKTFDVYSGYSKDGRLRTVVHWEDGEKTSVYLKEDDFDDIYLAIAYCYVKRKFGTMSHFRRIVERNTKDVTANVKRFIYGGDSTLLIPRMIHNMYSIYDQVALYLAISYLGDTNQWLTEEDKERLEGSVNE